MYMDLRHIAIAVCLGFCAFGADAQSINKWVDENGRTHYGEQPPANSAATRVSENLTVSGPASSAADEIVLYSTAWCGYCRKARKYMNDRGIAFVEKDIEKSRVANLEHKQFGGRGVPLLVRNGEETRAGFSLRGYDRFFAEQ